MEPVCPPGALKQGREILENIHDEKNDTVFWYIGFWHINKKYFYISTVFLQEEKHSEETMCHRHKSPSGHFTVLREAAGLFPAVLDESLSDTTYVQNSIFLPHSLP